MDGVPVVPCGVFMSEHGVYGVPVVPCGVFMSEHGVDGVPVVPCGVYGVPLFPVECLCLTWTVWSTCFSLWSVYI